MDEATANVDFDSDEAIQKCIRDDFAKCTIITIAHRLNTVLDYDRILVLDRGTIAEFDSPKELIAQKGAFYRMLEDSNTQ
jgi:ABC-type multidrug transport system fused ATPase/permease subunit